MEQRRFKGVSDLSNQRHLEDAKRLRKEAQGTPYRRKTRVCHIDGN